MNIGFDIDGVMTDYYKFMVDYGKPFFKTKYNKELINEKGNSIQELFGASEEEEYEFWKNYIFKYALLEKARPSLSEMMNSLKEKGDNIYIITSRIFADKEDTKGKLMQLIVKTWLKHNNLPYDDLIFTSNKKDAVLEYHIDCMIEDDVNYITNLRDYTTVLCMDSNYNEDVNFNDVAHVKDIQELSSKIEHIRKEKSSYIKDEIKPITGILSIDKPYQKYYHKKAFVSPYMSMYNYMKTNNIHNLDGIALEYYGTKITYREFLEKIDEAAKGYMNLGVKQNDIVTICMPNTPEAIISIYALNKIGAVANMIHPLSSVNEIKKYLNEVDSNFLLMIDMNQEKIQKIKQDTKLEKVITVSPSNSMPWILNKGYSLYQNAAYYIKDKNFIEKTEQTINNIETKLNLTNGSITVFPDNIKKLISSSYKVSYDNVFISWDDFIQQGRVIKNVAEAPYRKGQTAIIMHTGGTTGISKGVEHSSEAFNFTNIQGGYSTDCYSRGDKWLAILPIFHGFGLSSAIHVPLSTGITSILIPKPNLDQIADLILKNKPNHLSAVPAFWEAMINSKDLKDKDLSFIKTLSSGGDSISASKEMKINKFLQERGSAAVVNNGFGLTETISAFAYPTDKNKIPGTVGVPMYGVDVKIVNPETNEEVLPNTAGEMCVRGLNVMLRYYNNIEETNHALQAHDDGKVWLHTGDIAQMNEDGIITFVDRIKRMIIRNGYNIYSSEVERIIETQENVEKCIVVGPKNEKTGQSLAAYIVLNQENELDKTKKKIIDIAKDNLPRYAKIDYIIPILAEEIPRTKNLKVDYRTLTQMAEENINKKGTVLQKKYEK